MATDEVKIPRWRVKRLLRVKVARQPESSPSGQPASRILICMPVEKITFQAAQEVFGPLFRESKGLIRIIVHQAFFPLLVLKDPDDCIAILNEDIDPHQLPTRAFLNKSMGYRFTMAIDLNPEYNLFSAALVLKSGAAMRMGLKNPYSDFFFNMQIGKISADDIRPSYLQVKNLLEPEIGRLHESQPR